MKKKPDSLCTSKIIFALSLGLCFLGITSALTIPNQKAEHKPFFEGIKVVSGNNNNEKVEKTGDNLLFNNGIATISKEDLTGRIQDYTGSYASLFGGKSNTMVDSKTAVIFGGEDNTITGGGDYAYIIGGQKQDITNTEPTYYIGGTNNGFFSGDANNDHGIFIGGQDNEYIGENKNYISIIANNDTKVTKENSLLIHNNNTTNKTTIKNTFFYNNQENNAKNDNAAEFYSENGLQINTASSVSGITINAGGSFQMVPKDINDKNNLIKKAGSCNANNNGLYEVVNSGGDICVFYCNGHDWKDAFPGEVRYTGTNGNIETRSDQRKCNEWPTTKSKGDCVISGGMTIANGMTAELYRGDYPKCEKFIGTCKNGKIQDEDKEDVNTKQLRHICEAATGRCQATTGQRANQLIDENALPCAGINFSRPGSGSIYLTEQCPQNPAANTCPYYCKEGYKPYDSGSGTKCEEVFKIVFTGTSVTTGEIIFAGRKEAKNFIYSGQNRTGYTFIGWKNISTQDAIDTKGKFKSESDNTKIQGGTMVTGGKVAYFYEMMGDFDDKSYLTGEYLLTLTGLWEPNTYTINFSGNGGVFQDKKSNGSITCNYDNIQYNYDALYRLTGTPSLHCDISAYNNPTKTGYTFVGWEIQGMDNGLHLLYNHEKCQGESIVKLDKTYSEKFTEDGTEIKCVKNLTAQKNGSITFIAHWRPNKLIVNYYGNGADYAYVKGNDWTQFPDSYHVPIIKKQDLIPEENNYHKIPNPQTWYYDSPISKSYPYDYRTYTFSLTRSGHRGSGSYKVYLLSGNKTEYKTTITQNIQALVNKGDSAKVNDFANSIGVLTNLQDKDTTVNLYAEWEPCHAGWYCPADQEPQKCTAGSYSNTGVSSCTACQSGKTSIEGSMSCGTTCGNTGHVQSWEPASRNNTTNTVKNLCTIKTCNMGYEKNENKCEPKTYKITYNLNGGKETDPKNKTDYTIETPEFTLNNPTKTGYIFLGWTGSDVKDPQITVQIPKGSTGDRAFTANWEPIKYKIRYNGNGGGFANEYQESEGLKETTCVYDKDCILNDNHYGKDGYNFVGWSEGEDESIIFDADEHYGNNNDNSNYITLKDYKIPALSYFKSGDVFQLDVDIKGNGNLITYFHGYPGYRQVVKSITSDGIVKYNSIDGGNSIALTSEYKHYSVQYILGDGDFNSQSIVKLLSFRLTPGNSAMIKNVRVVKMNNKTIHNLYNPNQVVKNLTTEDGKTIHLYALWNDAPKTIKLWLNGGSINTVSSWSTEPSYYNDGETLACRKYGDNGYTYEYRTFNSEDRGALPEGWQCGKTDFYTLYKTYTYNHNIQDSFSLPIPHKYGYIFDGWYTYPQISLPINGINSYSFKLEKDDVAIGSKHYHDQIIEFLQGLGINEWKITSIDQLRSYFKYLRKFDASGRTTDSHIEFNKKTMNLFAHRTYDKGIYLNGNFGTSDGGDWKALCNTVDETRTEDSFRNYIASKDGGKWQNTSELDGIGLGYGYEDKEYCYLSDNVPYPVGQMNFRDIYYRDLSHGWDRFVIRGCYFPVRDSESYRGKINVVASILTGLPWVNRDSKTWTFIFSQGTTFKMNDDSGREWAKNDGKISAFINSEHNKNDIYDWRFLHNVAKTDTYVTPNYNEGYQELEYFGIKN